jgi:hypothetical protein
LEFNPVSQYMKAAAETLLAWAVQGAPVPPPTPVKHATLASYVLGSRYRRFVETGTYYGQTTGIIARLGVTVDSIELSPELHAKAADMFASDPNVRLHQGDSTQVLPLILGSLCEPAVFWLDGHYSAGDTAHGDKVTPIEEELLALRDHSVRTHIVLVDDMRGFGENGYPTEAWVREIGVQIVPGAEPLLINDSLIFASPEQHERARQAGEEAVRAALQG